MLLFCRCCVVLSVIFLVNGRWEHHIENNKDQWNNSIINTLWTPRTECDLFKWRAEVHIRQLSLICFALNATSEFRALWTTRTNTHTHTHYASYIRIQNTGKHTNSGGNWRASIKMSMKDVWSYVFFCFYAFFPYLICFVFFPLSMWPFSIAWLSQSFLWTLIESERVWLLLLCCAISAV